MVRGGPLADQKLAEALSEPARQLVEAIVAGGIPADRFWEHAAGLAAGVHGNRELANVVLTKCIGRSPRQAELTNLLAGAISALENAYDKAAPRSNDELELRSGPLREQWEARGPGLLAQIGRSTEPELIVPQADVLLVHPIQGGGGEAHLAYNSAAIEAVLTNPRAELPEVVRLAWLLAQLNNDLPLYQGNLTRDRAAELGAYALLPATLAAAESVELARCDSATLALAAEMWLDDPKEAQFIGTLEQWWQVYGESRPRWSVALAALDRLLVEGEAAG